MRVLLLSLTAGFLVTACSDTGVQTVSCEPEGSICDDGRVCLSHVCVACGNSQECGSLACIAGRCRACADDFQCGFGRLCRDGACVGCEKSADCDLGLACVDGACVPCGSSTDCADGRACIDRVCTACERTSQCDGGKVCVGSACVACTDRSQCEAGQACVVGSCDSCRNDDDCGEGVICAGGVCGACASRNQCPLGQLCAAGRCIDCGSSEECEQTEACVEGRCGRCASAAQCRLGQVCRDGECGPCGTSSECPAGLICRNRACEPCTSSAQCELGDVCVAGRCRGCENASECNAGEACVDHKCRPCQSPDECAPGDACAAGVCGPCTTSAQCRTGEVCRAATHRCAAPGAPDHLEFVGGQNQTGVVGTRLSGDLAVRVVDADGEPVPGVVLAFAATQGGGSPGAPTVTSDATGLAVTTWRLGGTAGLQKLVVARDGTALPDAAQTGRASLTYVATAQADHADHLDVIAGSGQTAPAGTRVPIDPKVQVVDQYGNGIPSISLSFSMTAGGGSVTPTTVTSDADGFAAAAVTLGATPGTNTLVVAGKTALPDVAQTGRASVTVTLTGESGAGDHLEKIAGDGQSAKLTERLAVNPKVKLVDRFGNAVSGVSLAFVAPSDITLSATSVTTDAQGFASVSATFGTVAGQKTISVGRAGTPLPDAAGTGRASVAFTATATPGDPDHLDLVAGDGQTAVIGTRVATDPAAKVVDRWGNALPGVSLTFTPGATSGSVTPITLSSGANGVASTAWTLGLKTGAQTLAVGRTGTALPDADATGRGTLTFHATGASPTLTAISPTWMSVLGGTLTITGTNFGSDATVTVGGVSANVTARSATQLVATVPATVPRGLQDVVVTSGGTATAAQQILMVLKFTPNVDGTIGLSGDWPPQALVASSTDNATTWGGNELRELWLGYDDSNVYIGIVGRAEKQNAIVGFISHDALAATRTSASGDIRQLSDGLGNGQGDGNGCFWQEANCNNNGKALSLDDMISAGFNCEVPGWRAYYAFGRTGNAVAISSAVHNAVGVRDLGNPADFGWEASTVQKSANAQEFALPWNTFRARDIVNGSPKAITTMQFFVRLVGVGGQQWPNQGLPFDSSVAASPSGVSVQSVSTLDIR